MTDQALPFHRFSFTLVANRRPRAMLSLAAREDGMYELHVERGSASSPTSQFTRVVPVEVAQRLSDTLQEAGAFGWDESYGDASAPGSLRWSLSIVFKKDVFSLASKGGSDVPRGFDAMLEELYRLDFPRPDKQASSREDASSAGQAGFDFSQLADMIPEGELAEALSQMQRDPQAMQQRMRDEFSHMSPDEQAQLLDMLASSGMASRAWWERFLRGF